MGPRRWRLREEKVHSRLLKNLDAVIESAHDTVLWARAMCRQASHFARQGETDEALRSIATVRSKFGHALNPEVAVWLMLAEGIISFSTVDPARFADRVKRAHGIAVAANYAAGRAAAAAWLALSCFNDRRYDAAIAFLTEAFEVAGKDDHQARARASLTLAICFHLAGRFDLARPWYEATRQHALAEGDDSTIGAMLFNVATFRASDVKFASALGLEFEEQARRANLEASSAAAFDQAIGTKSLPQLFPEFLAHLLVVEGKYQEALDQFQRKDLRELVAWGHAAYYADYATCGQASRQE